MSYKHIRFTDNSDVEDYQSSCSEDEDVIKPTNEIETSEEEEVFGIQLDSEESSKIAESDLEQQEEDGLPDIRAWGKEKRKYYSTDYVDPDYGHSFGKDRLLAELEEEEAKKLQMQLMQQLQNADFNLDNTFLKKPIEDAKKVEETVEGDVSNFTNRQKQELLQSKAPEFFALCQDFKDRIISLKYCNSILKNPSCKNKMYENVKVLNFVNEYMEVNLNYLINVSAYFLMKCQKIAIRFHPIMKRLFQYRSFLKDMDDMMNNILKPQVDFILQNSNDFSNLIAEKLKFKHKEHSVSKDKENSETYIAEIEKINEDCETEKMDNVDQDSNVKRAVTYQIAKNKGLMPHRKKEQRNPRVKHRMKYRKAKIRRKGAIREVRKELSRYSGELSGIKATVKKSISIKT